MSDSTADILIIGSGVAGSLLACELQKSGFNVHLIEAGSHYQRNDAMSRYRQAWNRNFQASYPDWPWLQTPHLDEPAHYYSEHGTKAYSPAFLKGIGGSTWLWTGMTPRFLEDDFRLRSKYGVGQDWPLSYAQLEPYYARAEEYLGVSGNSQRHDGSPRSTPYPMPEIPLSYGEVWMAKKLDAHGIKLVSSPAARTSKPYQQRPPCCGSNTCTPICPIGARFDASITVATAVRSGARLSDRMVAWKLENDGERISTVHTRTPDGTNHRLTANIIILACNAIETPRLLLMSANKVYPQGIANRAGLVGKNLMDHLMITHHFSTPEPVYPGRGPQAIGYFPHGRNGEFRHKFAAAKLFVSNDPNIMSQTIALLNDESNWTRPLDKLRQKIIHSAAIGAEIEVLPHTKNAVTLDESKKDPMGFPLPRIHYDPGDYSLLAQRHWSQEIMRMIDLLGGRLHHSSDSLSSHHPCGTVRMGESAQDAVVDKHCRSFDHPNLYMIGSGVFPTMGTANPTLTIAALALRLADQLKQA